MSTLSCATHADLVAARSLLRACPDYVVRHSRVSGHTGHGKDIRRSSVRFSGTRRSNDFSFQDGPAEIRAKERSCNDSLSAIEA
jgi:hypothetical protein